jgi:DDE superfamily endonuclease
MLPSLNLPASLLEVLSVLRPCFTAPGFVTFCGLVAGLAGRVRRRTVVGMLLGAALQHAWPHDRAHYFFARARWELDQLGLAVAQVVVLALVEPGADLRVAVDDSVFRRSGRKVHGAGWQHDGSSPAKNKLSYGNCFVTVAVLVRLPFCSREIGLPVLARLHLPGTKDGGKDKGAGGRGKGAKACTGKKARAEGPSKVDAAAALVSLLALAFPARTVHVVADAAYHGPALRTLPGNVTWTCRIPRNAALYHVAPPRTGKRGRPRTKGGPLGTPEDIAAAAEWETVTVTAYGREETRHVAEVTCLWYGSWHTRTVRLILSRDHDTAAGYDLGLVTTDLTASPAALVTRYAARWAIEQAFADARNVLGAGEARNRVRRAVERTVPFAMLVHTLIVVWYARHGHDPADVDDRRAAQPWYRTKTEPAFEDMLIKLRRTMIAARFSPVRPGQPEPEQIRAVLAAWAAAAA